jgi:secreted Zn-dependent insulinase-like peptidase
MGGGGGESGEEEESEEESDDEAEAEAAPTTTPAEPPSAKKKQREPSATGTAAATSSPASALKKRASSARKLSRTGSENGNAAANASNCNDSGAPKGAAGRRAAALRADLLDFHSRHYGAERMSLVIVGGRPLDELERWAEELFGPVPRRSPAPAPGLPAPAISFSSAGAPFLGRRLYVCPAVKQHHEVTVTFQLPAELRELYGRKAEHYISHLVGHEGPGSLLSLLKRRGWATALCAGVEEDGYASNSSAVLFSATVTLTEAGLGAAPGLGLAPVALLFAYLRLLRSGGGGGGGGAGGGAGAAAEAPAANGAASAADAAAPTTDGPPEWVWRELAAVAATRIRFQEDDEDPCDAAARLAPLLLEGSGVRPRHALCHELLHESWDGALVSRLLREHMDAAESEYRVDVMTSAFAAVRAAVLRRRGKGGEEAPVAAATAPAAGAADAAAPEHCHYHHHHHHAAPVPTHHTKDERPEAVEAEGEEDKGGEPTTPAAAAAAADAADLPAHVAAAVERAAASAEEIREPWFGLDAISAELPRELTDWWAGVGGAAAAAADEAAAAAALPIPRELALPPPNPFVPTDFALVAAGGQGDGVAQQPPQQQPADMEVDRTAGATATTAAATTTCPPALPPPDLLEDEPGLRLWHVLDRAFRIPRAHAFFRVSSRAANASPRAAALTHLWLRLAADALTEAAYLADVAGLTYGLSPEGAVGIEVRLDGFSHRMPELARRVFAAVAGAEVRRASGGEGAGGKSDEEQEHEAFAAVKESLVRKYRNMNVDVGRAATYARLHALSTGGGGGGSAHPAASAAPSSRAWHCDAVLAELEKVKSAAEVRAFARGEFLAECHVEALVAGNASASWARALVGEALRAIEGGGDGGVVSASPRSRAVLPASERPSDRCVVLPLPPAETSEPIVLTRLAQPAKNRAERNCCVEAYFQFGPAAEEEEDEEERARAPTGAAAATTPSSPSPSCSPLPWRGLKLRALADLADQVLHEPLYDSLRTKQQLGYGVSSGARLTHGAVGFCVTVVSASHSTAEIRARVDRFLHDFGSAGGALGRMTEREFAQHRDSVARHKLLADTCLLQAAEARWQECLPGGRYEFGARKLEAEAVRGCTLQELRAFYARALDPASRDRRALVVQVEPAVGGGGGGGGSDGGGGSKRNGGGGGGKKGGAANKKGASAAASAAAAPPPQPPGGVRVVDIGQDCGEAWRAEQRALPAPSSTGVLPVGVVRVAGAEK